MRASVGSAPDYGRLVASLAETLNSYDGPADSQEAAQTALPAAVGQPALMALYRQLAAAVGVEVGQISCLAATWRRRGRWVISGRSCAKQPGAACCRS